MLVSLAPRMPAVLLLTVLFRSSSLAWSTMAMPPPPQGVRQPDTTLSTTLSQALSFARTQPPEPPVDRPSINFEAKTDTLPLSVTHSEPPYLPVVVWLSVELTSSSRPFPRILTPPPHLVLLQPDKTVLVMLRVALSSTYTQPPLFLVARAPMIEEPTTDMAALSEMHSDPPASEVPPARSAVSMLTAAFRLNRISPPQCVARFPLKVFCLVPVGGGCCGSRSVA